MSSKKYIVGNWKSYKNVQEAAAWVKACDEGLFLPDNRIEVVICPAFPLLETVRESLDATHKAKAALKLGVQDISPFPLGKYTGAVAGGNLEGLGVTYALVGHSERRLHFHETHQDVALKVEQALLAGITPVVCVDDEYVREQAQAIAGELLEKCIVAYEPLEAIGTGHNQPIEEVIPVVQSIKAAFGDVPVIYGGSVDVTNIGEYISVLDGVLPGTSSLKADKFVSLVVSTASFLDR